MRYVYGWNYAVIASHQVFVDEIGTQTFNDYMQDYTKLKIKVGDRTHLQIKIQVCQNRNVHSQLVSIVGGTGITTIQFSCAKLTLNA